MPNLKILQLPITERPKLAKNPAIRYVTRIAYRDGRTIKFRPITDSRKSPDDRMITVLNISDEDFPDKRTRGIQHENAFVKFGDQVLFADIVGSSCGIPNCYCGIALKNAHFLPPGFQFLNA